MALRDGVTVLAAVAALAGGGVAASAPGADRVVAVDYPALYADAAEAVRQAVADTRFRDVLDLTPPSGAGPAPLHRTPNLDVAVIALDDAARPVAALDVLLSGDHPEGVVVPVDPATLSNGRVRYRWWDDAEWDADGRGDRDVLPGREGTPFDFTSPYPASVLKLMVAFGVLRLVDAGVVAFDTRYRYLPAEESSMCGGERTATVRRYLDEMITMSRNQSTCALLKLLHDRDAVDGLNRTFAGLGLTTLMITGTDPGTGGHWMGSNMGALDTAKLLVLVAGGPDVLWTTEAGVPVTADVLSPASREFLRGRLAEQGHNEMLSTTNWCGLLAPGIPQRTPPRWVNPLTGRVTVGDARYDRDVRPCDAAAEVTFAHKTGWTDTTGADAGIVRSLPGKPRRHYVVAVFGNLGTDYVDPDRPADRPDVFPVLYTRKYAELGRAVDTIMTR
ncbi:hypothetical protein GCM10022243_02380 [Saccharothrix violaceirubra]|uniref:Beta-lactamase class A catalytic domain-containing protein n=1 Tax=Saccharothrix violaceirubra TaxID=413306 RepID=A0A7W7T3N6_9PSEU|nr:serine hydrolase [Saccharothrix violaceirubra]MBB4965995.1 hypothetical protein [Saccharothrix violaceirubra]